MKICSVNIKGLKKFLTDNVFNSFCEQFDVIALYETWQTVHGEFDTLLPGYINFDCMRYDKNSQSSGGISVFIKESVIQACPIKKL